MKKEIETMIECPECKTKIDVSDLYNVIKIKVIKFLEKEEKQDETIN